MNEQQEKFLHIVVPAALECERALSLPRALTIVTISQAIAESSTSRGWGTSRLFTQANNPFGIKLSAHRQDRYRHFEAKTWEIEAGGKEEEIAKFQTFPNLREAFIAHAALLLGPHYRTALDSVHNADWSLEDQVRSCAELLGPKVFACPVHGITTPDISWSNCGVCGAVLSTANDHFHCGYCTNPNYGHLLWRFVEECKLLDERTLAKYSQANGTESQKDKG
jgi:flagellum-specific peptidoglycan hydrolase FlgJ